MLPISISVWVIASEEVWVSVRELPGFVSFFCDVPGPHDEILAQIWHYGFRTHHLGAEDIAENTIIIVEVDSQQLSLQNRKTEQ